MGFPRDDGASPGRGNEFALMFNPADAPTIETERLRLRAWRESDLDPFAAMMTEPDVARFLMADQRPADRASSWRTMAMFVGHWALKGYGMFVVEEKDSKRFVGRVGAWEPEGWIGFELGWGLMRRYWGRGYAFEAARAAGNWAFENFAPEKLVSLIHIENERSQALARRLDMQQGASTVHAGMPHVVWSITREAWRNRMA